MFPASLGGRRTNKGIYCEAHNNSLAPLAGALAEQLRILNALLAVRPDHKPKARPFDYISPQGDKITVFDGKTTRKNTSNIEGTMQLSSTFGGPNGLRAVGYIALTFLAHAFPENAVKPKLSAIKSFITNEGDNTYVWWERAEMLEQLPANPFPFGHTIAVMGDAASGRQTAFVSLFGSLNFGIEMGVIDGASSSTALYFIDPLADHPPDDIVEKRYDKVLVDTTKPTPLQRHLIDMVQLGQADQLQNLIARIERKTFDSEVESWLRAINRDRGDAKRLIETVRHGVESNQDKIYRLLQYVAEQVPQSANGQKMLQRIFAASVERSIGNPAELTPLAARCLEAALLAVIREIASRAAKRAITSDDLFEILSSGPGAALAGEAAMTVMTGLLMPDGSVSSI